MESNGLRILVRKEDDVFVAQCVDYDVCTQAEDIPTLQARMDILLDVEIKAFAAAGKTLGPAPAPFHLLWENADAPTHTYRIETAA